MKKKAKKTNFLPEIDLSDIHLNPLIQKLRKHPIANFVKYKFYETKDSTKIFYRYWKKSSENKDTKINKSLIIFFHGMAGHTEYWQLLADRLLKDCDLIGFDYRGHGYSQGTRGDIKNFNLNIEDAKEIIEWILNDNNFSRYNDIFLIGESMGSVLLANLLIEGVLNLPGAEKVKGTIYFAPAFAPKINHVPFKEYMKNIFYILLYPFNKGALRIYTRGNESIGVTNPIHQQYDRTDPLHLDYVSVRYLLQLKKYMDRIKKTKISYQKIPFLMFFGDNDFVIDHDVANEYFNNADIDDKKLYEIASAKHALFTEESFEEYWDILRIWIREHSKN